MNKSHTIRFDVGDSHEEQRKLEADIERMDSQGKETRSRKAILAEMKQRRRGQ